MLIKILEYVDKSGSIPYRNWILNQDAVTAARISTSVLRMGLGNFSQSKGVGSGVLEMRLDFGPGYRVYFGKDGEKLVILLCGGTKKKQQSDIKMAQAFWAEYKERKREK